MHLICSKFLKYIHDFKKKEGDGEEKSQVHLQDCYAKFTFSSYSNFIILQRFKHLRAVQIYFWKREALMGLWQKGALGI